MATVISGGFDVLNEDELEIYEVDPDHPARPMEVVFGEDGNHWLCDKGVDRKGDLAAQGCWRRGDFPFTRQD
jgi:hypothetical protein